MKVEHHPEEKRFVVETKSGKALLSYRRPDENTVNLSHTEVPVAEENQGIASALAKSAVEWARSEGLKVIPGCSYVKGWMERHPEYEDVLSDR